MIAEPRQVDTGGFALAFAAGFAGLGAEVVYLKALDFSVGAAPLVRLTVVATFIVGMGVGALWSARLKRPWLAELIAAAYALTWLLGYTWIFRVNGLVLSWLAPMAGPDGAASLIGAVHLVVPTLALGIALPAIIECEGDLGRVYAHHAVGALVGIILVEAVVYPTFGLPGAWGALVVAHLAALWLWLQRRRRRPLAPVRIGRPAWALAAAGVATGGYQGAWLLVAALVFRPYYFVVPSVIGAFVLGQALGALVWRRTQHDFATAVGVSAMGAAVSTIAAGAVLLVPRPPTAGTTAVLLAALIVPAAIPIGTLYPAWTRTTGRTRTGGALLSLSVGNAIGVFVGGGLLLTLMPALWVLVALSAALAAMHAASRRSVAVWVAVGAAAVTALRTDETAFFRGRDGVAQRVRARFIVRGPGELSAIYQRATNTDPELRLHQSGYSPVNLDPNRGLQAESTVGAFGVFHAPRRARALVLGAGSGRTAGFVATAFQHTDVVDIGATVPALLHYLHADNYALLANPRAEYHAMDGVLAPRLLPAGSYDLIVHTLHPGYVDRAAKLYTQEYLTALRGLLREDGVLVTWSDASLSADANRIYQSTLASVFPHVAMYSVNPKLWDYGYYVLISSASPARPDTRALANSPLQDDRAVIALLATPLAELLLPPLATIGRTHRFDRPAPEFLTGGFEVQTLAVCRGECAPNDTFSEARPCGPERAWRRRKQRVCTRTCQWSEWSEWSECAP